jgi:para-aminobenzoate synthetase/4-amino-4-deoxychorismate lyase
MNQPRVVVQVPQAESLVWWSLESPREVLIADRLDQVRPILRRVESAAAQGRIAAGFVRYEAAPAFDPALEVSTPDSGPLAWFAVFDKPEIKTSLAPGTTPYSLARWQTSMQANEYTEAIAAIHEHIARGETYQINFTLRLHNEFRGDPWRFFVDLSRGQRSRCCAYVDTTHEVLASASPELFFRLDGDRIWSRPMKGTAARGRTVGEDDLQARWLQASAKNRAENVMIVDMVRNDVGRIAIPETTRVAELWHLEKYPSLFQMTSTVEARTEVGIDEIFAALFPCASVTGAPKVRSMEIIQKLEGSPRGAYTGAIGVIGPGRRARFNVAIRTVEIDRQAEQAVFGTGSGVVWDSIATDEWRECRTKTLVLDPQPSEFELLETMLWEPSKGLFLLDRHLHRLQESARYFDFAFHPQDVRATLERELRQLPPDPHRVRLLLRRDGNVEVQIAAVASGSRPWRVAIAKKPVASDDRFLFHKTTHRQIYELHRKDFPEHDDVILWNEKGEITESTLANIVIHMRGKRTTPAQSCGLLAGTFRAELLEAEEIEEGIIRLADLQEADGVFLVNSVRRWVPIELDGTVPALPVETRPTEKA